MSADAEAFDPYHAWLSIPKDEQPPNHYRLLGVPLFERDFNVIQNAADRQMAHVKNFATGEKQQVSQKLLNEISKASICLLNPQKKAIYDSKLRAAGVEAPQPKGAPPKVEEGGSLAEYKLVQKIGSGVMGDLYKAEHKLMGRVVALKVLKSNFARNPKAVQRFQREVRAAAKLTHPNIVAALDAQEYNGIHYLVMEHVDGADLGSLLQQRGPLPMGEAVDYICQVCEGLGYAHQQGIVHRNIKPGNLLLDNEGKIRILDMGMARFSDDLGAQDNLTQTGQMMGTVDYMAPEQARDPREADARSDIYSVGCTWYRLVTGRAPYTGANMMKKLMAHIQQPIPSLNEQCPEATPELDAVFKRMLAKKKEERYASLEEVLADLQKTNVRSTAGSGGGLKIQWTPKLKIAVGVGILVVLALVAAALTMF